MARCLRALGPGPVLIVGTDIPALDHRRVARALYALKGADVVLGPAQDGGYWAIGLKRPARHAKLTMFEGVRWSSAHALADTVDRLPGLKIALTDRLSDVDVAADLRG
jgi:glycosyltransferase A (GT-A) superfamily protein (DUF2064 family)